MRQPGLGHTFSSFPPPLAIPPMAPVEAAVQKPTPVGFSLFSLHAVAVESDCHCGVGHWESPPTVVVLRDVIRAEAAAGGFEAEAFSSSGLAHVPVPKGGVGGACRVLVAALPSGATSLSSGSPVQGLAAVATVSLSLLVLLCSISRACVVYFFFLLKKNYFVM